MSPTRATSLPPTSQTHLSRVGLVLAGGSARGAYEVGVVRYVLEEVSRAVGRPVPLDVLSGTSAGSINAIMLAAHAEEPIRRGELLAREWGNLQLEDVVRPSAGEILSLAARMVGRPPRGANSRRGAFFDPSGIQRIVRQLVPAGSISAHLRAGRLSAISISTTHVASGKTVIFYESRGGTALRWSHDPTMVARAASITAEHAIASAAVPIAFPAVDIDGEFYCDGGLRQNVPLSPARRLGADGFIVINPRYIRDEDPGAYLAGRRVNTYPDPLFVAGKAMNALLLDRIENDIRRLEKLNAIIAAGERRYGATFGAAINEELGRAGEGGLKPIDVVYIRASADIGVMAAEYVRSPTFARRVRGLLGRALRRIGEAETEADLLSYVLFDGPFASTLAEIGWADAKAQHDALVAFFAKRVR
jgi:NTE family protein